jgi:hypothetical protein
VNLVRAELRRLSMRRFTRWMLLFVVLVLGAVVAIIAANNRAHTPEELERARALGERELQAQERWMEEEIEACERAQQAGDALQQEYPEDCEEIRLWYQQDSDMIVEQFLPPTFHFRSEFGNLITAFTGVLALLAFIVGASFVGAEWRSGGMTNLLLWRPRRLGVLSAKLGTLLGALTGLVVLLGALWTAALWLVASYRGITDTMTSGAWQSFGLTGLRGLTLVLVAGAVGFALASIGRHTATALGAAIAAFVVGFVAMSVLVFSVGVRYPDAWLWPNYLGAWMNKSVTFTDYGSCDFGPSDFCEPEQFELTWQVAGVGMAGVVVLLVGGALWHIRSRDVT